MERATYPARDAQTSANTAELLRETADLFLVHIIPAEVVGRDLWESDGDRFSLELGKAAAGFIAGELANAVSLRDFKADRSGPMQIGVAGGRTVFGLFNALSPQFPQRKGLQVVVTPLVTGPVPHSIYSASSVAELAAEKFTCASVPPSADIRLADGHFVLVPTRLKKAEIAELDWVVLGIGSTRSDSLKKHLVSISDYEDLLKERAVGDICSRLFDRRGVEVGREVSDKFVRLAMADLADLARRDSPQITRVVAVAGGRDKVEAMAAILRVRPRVVNFLVTDELTARAIIRKLRLPSSPPAAPTEYEQIPLSVLREHHGKWIVWDQEARCVLGVGETLEEANDQANGMNPGHLRRFHYACWTEEIPAPAELP